MTPVPPKKKRHAKINHPFIEAVVHGMFRFTTLKEAQDKLKELRTTYHLAKMQPSPDSTTGPRVKLWIEEFGVEPQERKQGYVGHYAIVGVQQLENDKFTLQTEKLLTPLNIHPRKKFPHQKQPHWAHPIMKIIKGGRVFASMDEAQRLLAALHEEYPISTVPGLGKLNAIVYEKEAAEAGKKTRPVKKYAFTIEAHAEGGFYVKITQSTRGFGEATKEQTKKEKTGFFSAKEQTRRQKKPRNRRTDIPALGPQPDADD